MGGLGASWKTTLEQVVQPRPIFNSFFINNVLKEEPHDFKQSLLAARKKITHREQQATTTTNQNTEKKSDQPKSKPSRIESRTKSVTSVSSVENVGVPEEIDPFVKEVLTSKTVPEPVKQKIRIECWSLFNDPRTPKGVKQCILATMLSKVQNE